MRSRHHEYSLGMISRDSNRGLAKIAQQKLSQRRKWQCPARERTVLKGLIGHSNSSGDQAPWECDGKNPVSCAELSIQYPRL